MEAEEQVGDCPGNGLSEDGGAQSLGEGPRHLDLCFHLSSSFILKSDWHTEPGRVIVHSTVAVDISARKPIITVKLCLTCRAHPAEGTYQVYGHTGRWSGAGSCCLCRVCGKEGCRMKISYSARCNFLPLTHLISALPITLSECSTSKLL